MSEKPKILCVSTENDAYASLQQRFGDSCEVSEFPHALRALAALTRGEYDGLYISAHSASQLTQFLQNERILDGMPDGVVMLDTDNMITWANERFRLWSGQDQVVHQGFYAALGHPEILGPDFCPFHTALATCQPSCSTLRINENRYFQAHAAPVMEEGKAPNCLIVTVRDVTAEMLQQQKLAAIHKAGIELSDLTPHGVPPVAPPVQVDDERPGGPDGHRIGVRGVEVRTAGLRAGELVRYVDPL